jgi:HD-GYP domain-containing protein (c-di-GMP phosphodiesterase class II)
MAEKELLLNALLGLSMIVEARDLYTGGHLWRVSQFSKLLAQQCRIIMP